MFNHSNYKTGVPAEYLGYYYDDEGWFPIYIHDVFGEERYKILNKLGFGGTAVVWAAQDLQEDTTVSIKVIMAKESTNNQELRILQQIQQGPSHPGRKHLPQLLDHFYEERYGKRCLFLVLELLGHPVSEFSDSTLDPVPSASRVFSKQLLLAVDCLHSHGIVHGDIHPQNILFRLPAGLELPLDKVCKGNVQRKDSAPLEEGLPKYVVAQIPAKYSSFKGRFNDLNCICLIDFSTSFFDTEPPESIHTVANMTSPELIFQKPLGKGVDIWSLACTIFYLANSRPLFETFHGKQRLIPLIHKIVGESSAQWLLTALIEVIKSKTGIWKNISDLKFDNSEVPILEDDDRIKDKTLIPFLRKCLVVDPAKRAAIEELLVDEWVRV